MVRFGTGARAEHTPGIVNDHYSSKRLTLPPCCLHGLRTCQNVLISGDSQVISERKYVTVPIFSALTGEEDAGLFGPDGLLAVLVSRFGRLFKLPVCLVE